MYLLLTLLLTHPLTFNLTTAVPNDIGDPLLNTWILAWDGHALLTDPLNLFNANIFYPLPNTLAYSEHLLSTALLVLPIQLIAGEPLLAYNLSLLLTFPLAAFGMYLLAGRWTRRRAAAFIAGLIFGFAPYRFAAIAHLQLLTFQWLPFMLLYLDKILADPPPTRRFHHSLSFGLFLLLQILASWYLALYTALILGVYGLIAVLTRRSSRSRLLVSLAAGLPVLLLTLPLVWPYLSLVDDLRQARPLSLALSLAAAPTDLAAAAPFNRLFGPLTESLRARPGFTEENTLFLGLVAPLLALVPLVRAATSLSNLKRLALRPSPLSAFHRSTLLALLFTLTLSLVLMFPMPYAALAAVFPPSTVIRVPARWIIPALFALAGLGAYGYTILNFQFSIFNSQLRIDKLSRSKISSEGGSHAANARASRKRPALLQKLDLLKPLPLLCSGLLIIEALSTPLPLAPIDKRRELNPAYHWLAAQAGDPALVELPLHSAPAPEFPEVKRLYASTLGWWSLANGYSGYTPPRQPALAAALIDFPNPAGQAIPALQDLAASSTPRPLLLLVHPGEAPLDRAAWETTGRWQAGRNPALLPLAEFAGDSLYRVLPANPNRFTGPPLATFGPEQTIRLLAVDSTLLASIENKPRSSPVAHRLTLFWQTTAPLPAGYTVFIHLAAADGFVRSQADGPPVSGHYPTTLWSSGEIIQDLHPLPPTDFSQIDHLAIGLYDPASGERLPAFGPHNDLLPDNALILPLP
ncbi:MAG: hypothetical protein AB1801_17175 [Chloroflexota bacterium]